MPRHQRSTTTTVGSLQVFNVKSYGAKGDGVTDDITAIQAAITAASPTGGIIFFPAGKYLISSSIIVDYDSITLQGIRGDFTYGLAEFGNGYLTAGDIGTGTTIVPKTTFTSGAPLILNNSAGLGYGTQTYDFAVRDMQLYCLSGGVQSGAPLAAGIKATAPEKCLIENVSIQGANGIGIYILPFGPLGDNATVIGCSIYTGSGSSTTIGIYVGIYESAIINCQALVCQVGIEADNGTSIIGCTSDGSSQYGFRLGDQCSLIGSRIWAQSGYSSVWLQGSYSQVVGNFFYQPGHAVPGDFRGAAILKGGGATDITITGNTVVADPGITYFVYQADTSATRMNVSGNVFSGTPTIAPTFDAMTTPDSIYRGNIGVADTKFGIGTASPATSALLELSSTTGSLLIPRMTTTQKNALTAVNGMIVYDSTLAKFQGYEAGAWTSLI